MAEAGWPVFPLVPRSKVPYSGSHGHKDATTDTAQVSRWAALNPDANVGVRPPAGVVVVDVDDPREFRQWVAERGLPLPRTREVATRRGRHLYYRLPAGADRPLRHELPGVRVDLKTERGFVLAPGSVHESGKVYRLVRELPLAALPELPPEWLPHVLRPERRPRPSAGGQGQLRGTALDVHRLARHLATKRPGDGRRSAARWAFCQAWRNFAHDPPALQQALRSLERAALDVGLDPRDVEGLLAYAEAEHTTTTEELK